MIDEHARLFYTWEYINLDVNGKIKKDHGPKIHTLDKISNQCLKLYKCEVCLTDFDYIRLFFEKNNHSSSNMGAEQKKDKEFQTFLDTHQYARKGILLYERIFGDTYVSTGGESTTAKFCSELQSHALKVSLNFR